MTKGPSAVVSRSRAGAGNPVGGLPAGKASQGSLFYSCGMRAPGIAGAGLRLQRAGSCSKVGGSSTSLLLIEMEPPKLEMTLP